MTSLKTQIENLKQRIKLSQLDTETPVLPTSPCSSAIPRLCNRLRVGVGNSLCPN